MTELTCTRCGAALAENNTCPYCGTRYKSDSPQVINNNTTNLTINIGTNVSGDITDVTNAAIDTALGLEPTQETQASIGDDESLQPTDEELGEDSGSTSGSFSGKGTILTYVASIALTIASTILARRTGVDWWWLGTIAGVAIIYFVSSKFKE